MKKVFISNAFKEIISFNPTVSVLGSPLAKKPVKESRINYDFIHSIHYNKKNRNTLYIAFSVIYMSTDKCEVVLVIFNDKCIEMALKCNFWLYNPLANNSLLSIKIHIWCSNRLFSYRLFGTPSITVIVNMRLGSCIFLRMYQLLKVIDTFFLFFFSRSMWLPEQLKT